MPDRNISTYASSHFYDSIDFNRQPHRWHPQESISWVRVLRQNSVFGRRGVGELINAFFTPQGIGNKVFGCVLSIDYTFGTDNISVDSSCPIIRLYI